MKSISNHFGKLLIVCGPFRSGTSLTMGLLASQGVWVGDCAKKDKMNPKGYFENNQLGYIAKQRIIGEIASEDIMMDAVLRILIKQKYNLNTPWAIKQKVTHLKLWRNINPIVIVPKRDVECIARSRLRTNKIKNEIGRTLKKSITFKGAKEYAIRRYTSIKKELSGYKHYYLDTNNIVSNNDYSKLEIILNAFNFQLDVPAAVDFVDSKYWHYR